MKISLIMNRSEQPKPEEYGYVSSWVHATKKNPTIGLRMEAGISGVPDILMELTPAQAASIVAHLSGRIADAI